MTRRDWHAADVGDEAGTGGGYPVSRRARGGEGAVFSRSSRTLDRGEFVDASPAAASRYRLIAINGLGEEYVLGEASLAPALATGRAIAAYPNPSRGSSMRVVFRVPADPLAAGAQSRVDLSAYDASGRRVRALDSGTYASGVREIEWDGRDESGQPVGAGTYFLRLSTSFGIPSRRAGRHTALVARAEPIPRAASRQ